MMAVRFDDRAQIVMHLANQEAQRFCHGYVGTEHILLGLVTERAGVAAEVLRRLGVDQAAVCSEIERIVLPGPDLDEEVLGRLSQTPRAKRVIELAVAESQALRHESVGTEHLLVGLIREQEGVAAQVLMNLGLKVNALRPELQRELARRAAWLTANDRAAELVAHGLAESRRWAGLPVLADALQEAGCDDEELLVHLRRGADHGCPAAGPGCWALERLLRSVASPPAAPAPARRWWQVWG
jgi:ATP-dependent Clp protease ATP-binding subunit ClpA